MGDEAAGAGNLRIKLVNNLRNKNILAILKPDNLVEFQRYDLLIEIENFEGGDNLIFRRLDKGALIGEISHWEKHFSYLDIYVSPHSLKNYFVSRKIRRVV